MNAGRFEKVQNNAYSPYIERREIDRAVESFERCTVLSRQNESKEKNHVLSIFIWDMLEETVKSSVPYVFAAYLPAGNYKIIDYDCDYVILKNLKRNKYYLNQIKHWDTVKCLAEKCYGRGFKRIAVKRQSNSQLKVMLGENYRGAPGRPYIEENCPSCNDEGLIDDLLPKYPEVNENLLNAIKELDIKEIYVFNDGKWDLQKIKKTKSEKESKESKL